MADHASTLGTLLRDARERLACRNGARVRQADVAEHADITVEWYARIERGSVLPSFDVLSRIAAALCLSSRERVEALRFVVPDLLRHDGVDPVEPAGRATRELRAHRRFQRRAESASTPHELFDMAVSAVMDGLTRVAFTSIMVRSAADGCWLHRSVVHPDVAEAVNRLAPIDDRIIKRATLEHDGLRFVGSSDYGTASIAPLRERDVHTDLRSGFGVPIPLTDGILGYCRRERGAPDADHIVFLGAISSIVALTARGSSFSPDQPPATTAANSSA